MHSDDRNSRLAPLLPPSLVCVIIVLAVALDMWRADIGQGIAHVSHLLPFAGRAEQSARQAERMQTQPKR